MKKILVIEDNQQVRENIAEILELSEYQVITAENGKVGVDKALSENPDLILCDVMMPVLDGFGVLRILEKKISTAHIPFIFLTAKAEKTDFRKGMNLGADDYITKPFDDVELLDSIEMRLKKSDRLQSAFDGTTEGLSSFINEAKGRLELNKLSSERDTKELRKKDFLYREGEHARQLFFIERGSIKTFKTNDYGKEYITHVYNKGEFLGYQALIQDSPYDESAMAIEESVIRIIPKEDFYTLIHNNKDVAAHFMKILANNVAEKEQQLLSLAYNSIRKRVAEALVALHNKAQQQQQQQQQQANTEVAISISRGDLAAIVGTAKESVIRTLRDFKDEGLVELKGAQIFLQQKSKLAQLPN